MHINKGTAKPSLCTPDIKLLTISLRSRANASAANQLIGDITQRLDTICPDAPKYILVDFNHCKLVRTLNAYEQYVSCATIQKHSTIDLCYGSIGNAYKSLPMSS